MIVNIPNDILKLKHNSIIIFDETTNSFKVIDKDEFLSDFKLQMDEHQKEFEVIKNQIEILQKADLIVKINEIESKIDNDKVKSNLVNYMAFQLLLNAINNGDVEEPANFNFIQEWLLNPTEEIPDGFEIYIKKVKGE